jgi:hypothetical protein
MDRWKSRGEKSQKKKGRRKKIQAHEKVEKSRNTVFFSNVLWLRRNAKQWTAHTSELV